MDALRRAVVAGNWYWYRLQTDDNFKALRERNDWKELATRLETIKRADALRTPAGRLLVQQELLVIRRQLADAHPDDETTHADLAAGYEAIGVAQLELGKAEATKSLARAVALRQELVKTHRLSASYRGDLVHLHLTIADAHSKAGRLPEGLRAAQEALAVLEAAAREGVPPEQLAPLQLSTRMAITDRYAQGGLWREAADQCDEVVKFGPGGLGSGTPLRDWYYYRHVILRLRSGDVAGYRRTCAALVGGLTGTEEPGILGVVARSCAVGGDSGIDPARSVRLAEKAVAAFPQDPWWHSDLALACYRAGQFDRAITEATWVAQSRWTARGVSLPVLAMTHHRLGHADEARRCLAQARVFWQQESPLAGDCGALSVLPTSSPHWQGQWQDWPTFEVLFHEATLLITGARPRRRWTITCTAPCCTVGSDWLSGSRRSSRPPRRCGRAIRRCRSSAPGA